MIYIILFLLTAITVSLIVIIRLLNRLINLNSHQVAEEYAEAVKTPKTNKPALKAVKQKLRGRSITNTEDLVDIADLPWEEAYKIVEDIGN